MSCWDISGSYIWAKDRSDCINPWLNVENAHLSMDLTSIWNAQYMIMPQTGSYGMMDMFSKMMDNALKSAMASVQTNSFLFAGFGSGFPTIQPPKLPAGTKVGETNVTKEPEIPENLTEEEKITFKSKRTDFNNLMKKVNKMGSDTLNKLGIDSDDITAIEEKYAIADTADKIQEQITALENLLKSVSKDKLKDLCVVNNEKYSQDFKLKDIYDKTIDAATVANLLKTGITESIIMDETKESFNSNNCSTLEFVLTKRDDKGDDAKMIKEAAVSVVGVLLKYASENYSDLTTEINSLRTAKVAFADVDWKRGGSLEKTLITAYNALYVAIRKAEAQKKDEAFKETFENLNIPDIVYKDKMYNTDGTLNDDFKKHQKKVSTEVAGIKVATPQ